MIYNDYNKTVFIYDKNEKKVYGVSLPLLEYVGRDKYKFLKWINTCHNITFLKDLKCLPVDIVRLIDNKRYLAPVLYDTLTIEE
jgi:hypothetical protein